MATGDPSEGSRTIREARSVGADRAFAWYSEAMRLFKRHPLRLAGLSLAVFASALLTVIPTFGAPAARIVVPLVACSLLYASLAIDRGDRPRLAHLMAPFAAPLRSIAAIVAASLVVFGVESLVAWQIADVNPLSTDDMAQLGPAAQAMIYGSGVAVSLPLMLVPMLAVFEGAGTRDAFAASAAAFVKNMPAFLLYGALSIALLGIAFATRGLALPIVLPLWAASSFAAWKDLYSIA